jgi:probable HAF family extracellular repeat protein
MIDLGTLGGNVASGQDINNKGQVAGSSSLAGDIAFHAFLYTPGIGMMDLGTLGANYSNASALNDHGEVVGESIVTGFVHHAFLYVPGQGMTDLGALKGDNSSAFGINQSGQIIGATGPLSTAFLYSGGITVDLGSLNLTGINDLGQIVANSSTRDRAFLLTPVPEPASAPLIFAALLALCGSCGMITARGQRTSFGIPPPDQGRRRRIQHLADGAVRDRVAQLRREIRQWL